MTRLKNYAAIWLSLGAIALYVTLYEMAGRELSKFFVDWLALIGSAFLAASTVPSAWRAIRNGARTGEEQFLVCFWMVWTFLLVQRLWLVVITVLERPAYLIQTPVAGMIALMLAIAAGYGIAAPLNGPADLPRQQIATIVLAALFAGAIAGLAIGIYLAAGWA